MAKRVNLKQIAFSTASYTKKCALQNTKSPKESIDAKALKISKPLLHKKIPKNTHKNIFDIHDIEIRGIYYTLSCSVSSSRSISGFELQHPDPRQLPRVTEQFSPCFLQEHLSVLQSVWQLHLTICKSSLGQDQGQ